MMQHIILVNPHSARSQRIANPDSSIQIAGVDSAGETIGGCVAEADGISFGLEFRNGADGPEDLFLHDLHVFADATEDRRLNEVALFAVALAADFDLGAFGAAGVDVAVRSALVF